MRHPSHRRKGREVADLRVAQVKDPQFIEPGNLGRDLRQCVGFGLVKTQPFGPTRLGRLDHPQGGVIGLLAVTQFCHRYRPHNPTPPNITHPRPLRTTPTLAKPAPNRFTCAQHQTTPKAPICPYT